MQINRKKFFDGFRPYFKHVTGKPLTPTQVANLERILSGFESSSWFSTDVRLCAYALATVHIETYIPKTNSRYAPVTEAGPKSYFNRYDIKTNPRKAKELGNVNPGDGYLFRGRGYVQLTGRTNYQKFGIEDTPDAALDPATAMSIMERGMKAGTFTGQSLRKFINARTCDYKNARRVINGLDRAQEIADLARNFEHFLRESISAADAPMSDESESLTSGSTVTNQTTAPEGDRPPTFGDQDSRPTAWERLTAWQQKLDIVSSFRNSLSPFTPSLSPISGMSWFTTVKFFLIGWLTFLVGFVEDNPEYLIVGVVIAAIGAVVFVCAKRNAAKRVAPPVQAQEQTVVVK